MEGVPAAEELAVLVPAVAQLVAAAHVGHGVDHAAIEIAQPVRREGGLQPVAVGAVAVEQARRPAPLQHLLASHHGEWHLAAVARDRPQAFRRVELRLVAARDALDLAHLAPALGHVPVEHGGRGHGRGVAEAHEGLVELPVAADGRGIQLLAEIDAIGLAVVLQNADVVDALAALLDHQEIAKAGEVEQVDRVGGRDHLLPAGFVRILLRCGDEAEVAVAVVGQHEQPAAGVLHPVVVALAPRHHGLATLQGAGVEQPHLAGDVGAGPDHHEAAASRLADADEEGGIGFLVEHAWAFGRVDAGRQHPVRAKTRIELHHKQGAPVLGPHHAAAGIGKLEGQVLAAGEIAHPHRVALRPVGVGGIGEQPPVGAGAQRAQVEVVLPLGEAVLVEDRHERPAAQRPAFPHPVLGTRGIAPAVFEGALAYRDRLVLLLDAAPELGEEPFLEVAQMGGRGLPVGVLRLDAGQHVRIPYLRPGGIAHPGEGVLEAHAEVLDHVRHAPRRRRLRRPAHGSLPCRVRARACGRRSGAASSRRGGPGAQGAWERCGSAAARRRWRRGR
ncbi:hypothetical protein HRbin39_01101 [bacterium HR39]|nr:hypothetical protein HRbin39_01101 [bacterium HR39]